MELVAVEINKQTLLAHYGGPKAPIRDTYGKLQNSAKLSVAIIST